MKIENSFRVDLPLESAWATLTDVPSLVPCMPGAQLLAIEDERNFRGQVAVKLGPITVVFRGRAKVVELDAVHHLVRASASGTEASGRGSAQAEVAFQLTPDDGGTRVDIVSNVMLAGAVAQYGRAQGVIADVSQVIVNSFANNLSERIAATNSSAVAPVSSANVSPVVTPAISIFTLIGAVIQRWFARFKERLVL